MTRVMPAQKPGRSEQEQGTPRAFLDAIERRFGPIRWDLAAHAGNHVAECWYGPGSQFSEDSLTQDWGALAGVLWLNPPFARIGPWAEKCKTEGRRGARTVLLVPAGVGAAWFAEHVHGHALVLALRPRLTFVGSKDPYPKDLLACAFGPWVAPGFTTWKWSHPTEACAP